MKSIELTVNHKSKLLEMCNKLFCEKQSEFKKVEWSDNCSLTLQFYFTDEVCWYSHWFEFCMTHLINRINYPKNKVNNLALITTYDIVNFKAHPVDYLYSQFKLINK